MPKNEFEWLPVIDADATTEQKRLAPARAKVCRRRIAIQPFNVIRGRTRSVLARNPRSSSRSTTTEGGHRFLKNAKSRKKLRSPRCRSRSTQERANDDGPDNFAPRHS